MGPPRVAEVGKEEAVCSFYSTVRSFYFQPKESEQTHGTIRVFSLLFFFAFMCCAATGSEGGV